MAEGDDFRRGALAMDGKRVFFVATKDFCVPDIDTCEEAVLHHFDDATELNGRSVGGDCVFQRVGYREDSEKNIPLQRGREERALQLGPHRHLAGVCRACTALSSR